MEMDAGEGVRGLNPAPFIIQALNLYLNRLINRKVRGEYIIYRQSS